MNAGPDIRPGEATMLAWDPNRQSVDFARGEAEKIRRKGGKILGCTLDTQVRAGQRCPVCFNPGLMK
jgi:hypothetical protein